MPATVTSAIVEDGDKEAEKTATVKVRHLRVLRVRMMVAFLIVLHVTLFGSTRGRVARAVGVML